MEQSSGELHRSWGPEPDSRQVLACLNRILRSPAFQGSKRCQELLHFLVSKRLDGDMSALKERIIGAELFGRDPAYDTSSDAIVRVKANEVRKRLAAYYGEWGRREPLRIELPVGSYVPVFRWAESDADTTAEAETARKNNGQPLAHAAEVAGRARLALRWSLAAAGLLVIGAVAWLLFRSAEKAFDLFWAPFYKSSEPVLFCIPARDRWFFDPPVLRALAEAAREQKTRVDLAFRPGNIVSVPNGEMSVQNFRAVLQLAIHLARRQVPIEVRLVSEVSAEAIRRRQVILLGAYHNPWAMELGAGMRYTFESEGEGSGEATWVRDRNAAGRSDWRVPRLWPYAVQNVDYAIISRTFIPLTGQIVVSLAGVNGFGTQVAAEFLTSPQYWQEFSRLAAPGWHRRNCQVVLETRVVREVPNPPRVLAVHVW